MAEQRSWQTIGRSVITTTVGDFVEFNIPVHLCSELRNPMLSNRFFRFGEPRYPAVLRHMAKVSPPMVMPLLARMPVALIAVTLALLSPVARSMSICRWVDENGRTQMSDVVPDKYKKAAICSDSQKYELSPEQEREAQRRAAEAQRRTRHEMAAPPTEAASSPPGTASLPSAKRPTEVITDATDCQTRWRIYDESAECFGPYRTARGATKQEGFDKCNVIPSPEMKCGPRSN